MANQDLHLREVKSKQDLTAFIRFPWEVYRGDRCWVPPLIKDQSFKLSPAHPFRSHSDLTLFLARKGGRTVGRIAGIVDHHFVQHHREKTGFYGFFESLNDERVSGFLFSGVRDWLRGKGMEKMIGPMNPSTNDECGLLVDGFDTPPSLMMPYNPTYYPSLFEAWGLRKEMDLYTYLLDELSFRAERLERLSQRLLKREPKLRIRPLEIRRLGDELKIIREIYNDAWSRNWGFVPITEAEIEQMARELKPLVVPEIVPIAFWEDEPIAFSVALPDYYEVLRHLNGRIGVLGGLKFLYYSRKIRTVRVMLLGVKQAFQKRGVESLLYLETCKRSLEKGYRSSECSWILENNLLMQHGLEAMGAKRHKTYRIYQKSLGSG